MCSGVRDQCVPWACLRWGQLPLTTSVGNRSRPSSMERIGVAETGYCAKGPSRGMVLPTSTPASAACNYAFSNSLALALSSNTDLTSSRLCLFCRVRNTIRIPHLLYFQPCLPSSLSLHTCAPLHMACPHGCSTPPTPCLACSHRSHGPYEAFHSQALKRQGANETPRKAAFPDLPLQTDPAARFPPKTSRATLLTLSPNC